MADAHTPLCPRCRAALAEQRSHALTVLGCPGCGGTWIDNDNARRALADAASDADHLSRTASRAARRPVSTGAPDLPCPVCERTMTRLRLSPSNVEIDLCQDHGTWFDRDELAAALRPDPSRAATAPAKAPLAAPPGYAGAAPPGYVGAEPEVVPDFRAGTDAAVLKVITTTGSILVGILAVVVSIASGGDDDD